MRLLLTSDLHRDSNKLRWLLEEAPPHDALLVAGDLLNISSRTLFEDQVRHTLYWKTLVQKSGKSFAWCSGKHDLFEGEKTPMLGASPKWMHECPSSPPYVTDGESRVMEVAGEKIVITTIPFSIHGGGQTGINGYQTIYSQFVLSLLSTGLKLQIKEKVPWIVLCHQPPGGTPICGNTTSPEADFVRDMIKMHELDFSLHGNIHLAPIKPGGSWHSQINYTIYRGCKPDGTRFVEPAKINCFNSGQSEYDEAPYYILLEFFGVGKWTATWSGNGKMGQVEDHSVNCTGIA